MSPNYRRLENSLTAFWGVFAAITWTTHGALAALADHPLSTKALFVWMAAAMTGLVIGLTLGFMLAPLRAKQLQSSPATTRWDLANSQLASGIFFLGMGTGPVHSLSVDVWEWAWSVTMALLGAMVVGLAVVVRGERRLLVVPAHMVPPPQIAPPHMVPPPGVAPMLSPPAIPYPVPAPHTPPSWTPAPEPPPGPPRPPGR